MLEALVVAALHMEEIEAAEEVRFQDDQRVVRTSYTRPKAIPEAGTKTGNWCRLDQYDGDVAWAKDCGYQTKEYCRITINEYKNRYAVCERKK